MQFLQPLPHIQKEFSKFRLQVNREVHSQISIQQFRFSKFSLQLLQPLPHIQKEFSKFRLQISKKEFSKFSLHEIQLAGSFDFRNSVCRCYNHFQISKKEFSKFSFQVNCCEVHSQISIEQFRFSKFSMQLLCLKEKVLLGKWSAIAMLELQRIRFAGWELRFRNSVCKCYNHFRIQKGIFEIQLQAKVNC